MQRANFFLPKPLIKRLAKEAKQTGLSQAEIVRRALDAYFSPRELKPRSTDDADR